MPTEMEDDAVYFHVSTPPSARLRIFFEEQISYDAVTWETVGSGSLDGKVIPPIVTPEQLSVDTVFVKVPRTKRPPDRDNRSA